MFYLPSVSDAHNCCLLKVILYSQEIADVEFVTVEESGLFGSSVIVVDKGKARTQVQAETISSNDISVRLADRLKVSHIKKEQVVARERALEAFKEDRKQNKKQQ